MQASPLWRLPEGELTAEILACEDVLRGAYGRMLQLVAEADQRDLGTSLGYKDTVAFLKDALRVSTREAKARLAHADAVVPGRTVAGVMQSAPLDATGKALRDKVINREHVDVIHRVFAQCPGHITDAQRAETEDTLLELARQSGPEAVRKVGRRLVYLWDQDGKPPADEDKRERGGPRREFDFTYGRDGSMKFRGSLDPEAAAQLEGLFGPLAKPRPADEHGNPDTRSTIERQGDALAEIIDLAARADELSVQGGERAVITVTVTLAELEGRLRDALLTVPGCTSLNDLRYLACEARVVPAVFGNEGEILYLGRSSRYASKAQRRALALRDKGCARPGCTRTPKYCHVHHVKGWANHGDTDIDEMCLLCTTHHREIHHSGWEIRMVGGIPWFIPPAWLDSERRPMRNLAHTIPTHQADAA